MKLLSKFRLSHWRRHAVLLCCLLGPTIPVVVVGLGANELASIKEVYGERARKRVLAWQALVQDNQSATLDNKLERVNGFFNQLYFVNDIDLWGKKDYWATPVEFIGANAGDCEDFSIAKYYTLLKLGIPEHKMRLVYVKSLTLRQFHMVVAYYETPSSMPVLLDNIDGEIKPADQRRDLVPIYSFNGENLWLMKSKGQGKLAGKASRLSLWNDVREREEKLSLRKPLRDYD